jgi:hypothetical protein
LAFRCKVLFSPKNDKGGTTMKKKNATTKRLKTPKSLKSIDSPTLSHPIPNPLNPQPLPPRNRPII